MGIAIFGSTGFVGTNFIANSRQRNLKFINRGDTSSLNCLDENINAVLNFVGKAHDVDDAANYEDYYISNTLFCNKLFDTFLQSQAEIFITISSVKAVADELSGVLTEEINANPKTYYGETKLLAENYILSKNIPKNKRVYILRPCVIYGPGNKGNLNLLFKFVRMGIPWPLGKFENKKSFCSVNNLCFIIDELIDNKKIPSGVYNIADDETLSTNQIVSLIAEALKKPYVIYFIPIFIVNIFSKLGDFFMLPFNSSRLKKLTQDYIVSNDKIKSAIGKPLPVSSRDGLLKTFESFKD